jgi:hypothetical protein
MVDKASNQPAINCSTVELSFLASLLGANMLLGIQDPFPGWLAEEIEAAWAKARDALAARRFLEAQPDGGIVMDTGVAALVGTCAFPEASFIVTSTSPRGTADARYYHVTKNLAVEQRATANGCQLTAIEDAPAAFERIIGLLQVGGQGESPGTKTTVLEETLTQARSAITTSGTEGAAQNLVKAGVEEGAAMSLADALAHPVANGAIVALAKRELSWEVAGLGLLEGRSGLWELRSISRGSENWVEATPCDGKRARQDIRRLMNRVLPVPLAPEGEVE